MSSKSDHLKTLHTSAIDAKNGYGAALEDAEGKGMTPLFRDMMALHERHATELSRALEAHGIKANSDGSFLSVVHRTIMDVRSLFSGLDESVLPGLIDGEKRNVAKYDDAINVGSGDAIMLERQRSDLSAKIDEMKQTKSS